MGSNNSIGVVAKPYHIVIGLPAIHTKINGVFQKNLLGKEDLLRIRDIGLKRKPKNDGGLH